MTLATSPLADAYAPIVDELARARFVMERELDSALPFVNELCGRVNGYRGKMLRPALVLFTAQACGRLTDAHVTAAAVVELVHLATLVHDDVLDEADVRRRRPTINALHGNEAAVLLGDYFISHAFHLCSSLGSNDAARLIGATTNTVCEGELMQIHHRNDLHLTEGRYLEIIGRKTAALTGTCCELGARLAGVDDDAVGRWRRYGIEAGIAFQIVDDVLDFTGQPEETGKPRGRDLEQGKPTLPVIHCLANATPAVQSKLRRYLASDNGHQPNGEVRRWLAHTASLDYAMTVAGEHVHSALAHLYTLAPSSAKDALIELTEFILRRRR